MRPNSGSGFTYDANKIAFAGGKAKLKLISNPSQTFLPVLADSDFDADLVEYASSVLRQKSQRPAGAVFGANYESSINANWANGSLVGTPTNGADVFQGKLQLQGGDKSVDYDGQDNVSQLGMVGCVRFRVTPNYNGSPVDNQEFITICNSDNQSFNKIQLFHATNGAFFLLMNDQDGVNILSNSVAPYVAVAGQTVEMELSWDLNAGKVRFFGEGYLVADIDVSFVRSNDATIFRVGGATGSEFSIDNLIVFDSVQHTANYTPNETVIPDADFVESGADLPAFSYSGVGNVVAFSGFSATDTNSPRYTVNGKYWNGSAWVVSDGSYAQANPKATINTNIGTLTAANTAQISVVFTDGNTLQSVGAVTLIYTGQIYPTDNPSISPNSALTMDIFSTFAATISASGGDGIKFYLKIGSTPKYWNGTAWVTSNETYAQSNTAAEINTNASSLDVSAGVSMYVYALLHSNDGSTTPELDSATVEYSYYAPQPTGPALVTVYGYILDEAKEPIEGAVVTANNPTTIFNQGIVMAQGSITATTNELGYFELEISETENCDKKIDWSVKYPAKRGSYDFGSAIIPEQVAVNIEDLDFTT